MAVVVYDDWHSNMTVLRMKFLSFFLIACTSSHIVDDNIEGNNIYYRCSGNDACTVLKLRSCDTEIRSLYINDLNQNVNYTFSKHGATKFTRVWTKKLTPQQQTVWLIADSGDEISNNTITSPSTVYDITLDVKQQYKQFKQSIQTQLIYNLYSRPQATRSIKVQLSPGDQVNITDKSCDYVAYLCEDHNKNTREMAVENMKNGAGMRLSSPNIWNAWVKQSEAPVDFQCVVVGNTLVYDIGLSDIKYKDNVFANN